MTRVHDSFPNRDVVKRHRRAVTALTLLTVATLLMPACWGKRELEERSFVTLLGIDKGSDRPILATAAVTIPRAAAGGQVAAGGGPPAILLSAEGQNITDAIRNIETVSSRDLTTNQASFLLLGEDFSRDDIGHVIDVFARNLEFRHNTFVAVCRGRAGDFLSQLTSLEEREPSVFIEKMIESTYLAYGHAPLVTMHEFILAYNTLQMEPWAPLLGLRLVESPSGKTERGGGGQPPSGTGSDSGGGEAGIKRPERAAEVLGAAVFSKQGTAVRMVGELDRYETMAAIMLRGELRNGALYLKHPISQEEVTLAVQHVSTILNVRIQDPVLAQYAVRITTSLEESPPGEAGRPNSSYAVYRDDLIYTAQDQLRELLSRTVTKLQSLQSDVLRVGREVQTKIATYPEWEEFNWPQRFPETRFAFDVKIHILTTGFLFERSEPK